MTKWIVSALSVFSIAALLAANYLGLFAPSFSSIADNPIQRVELSDLDGSSHSFDELAGHETVIYFFASWCAPCYKTLRTLEDVSQKNRLKLNLLTVALDDDVEGVADMVDKTGFTGTVWLVDEGTSALQKRYFGNEQRAVPYIVKLDNATSVLESTYDLDTPGKWQDVLINGKSLAAN